MKTKAPVFFISHGAPSFALSPDKAGKLLNEKSSALTHTKAIVIISPHWQTRGNFISTHSDPKMAYDFGGFSSALKQLNYPALGDTELAKKILSKLVKQGVEVQEAGNQPWDHGVWIPLLHLRPQADIPVIQLSLNHLSDAQSLYNLGKFLQPLREDGIAIIASGGLTHNLYDVRMSHDKTADYAELFQQWARLQVLERNIEALKKPASFTADFSQCHPTEEHYLPLLIAMGASTSQDTLDILKGGMRHYSLSMESYVWQ